MLSQLASLLHRACQRQQGTASVSLLVTALQDTLWSGSACNHWHQTQHRHQSTSRGLARVEPGVVPEELLREWQQLETKFKKEANVNGAIRLPLSITGTPQPLPQHDIEPGLHTVKVHLRGADGSIASKWLRRAQRTPARVQSVWPGNKGILIHMSAADATRLVHRYGRHGCQARVIALDIVHPQDEHTIIGRLRVKPQIVHMAATKHLIENIDFLFCPQNKMVKVNVPIRLINDDVAPGTKAGGWMHAVRRAVPYLARGDSLVPYVEVDVKSLNINDVLTLKDMPVPPNMSLADDNLNGVVVKCTTETGN